MRVDILSREYPPDVYGGAGVHVTELVRALRPHIDVRVRAFGGARAEAGSTGYPTPAEFVSANPVLGTLATDLLMAGDVAGADLVHSHTWYANFAGYTAKKLHGIPHVVTAHSLEPLRPWKAEQLGNGYRLSSWVERAACEDADAVIAVSEGMRRDILRVYPSLDPARVEVVYNGVDLAQWRPHVDFDTVRTLGINPDRRSVVFVGRITRQKGLSYLLRAARVLPPDVQLVLCASAPDTPEIFTEVTDLVGRLQRERSGVVWIDRHLSRSELSAVLSGATCFVCPSIYEPLGIVNLEAMACGVAVVATATGGIPEVVEDGVTGVLVPIDQVQDGTGLPRDPERFVADLGAQLCRVVADPDAARMMGVAGRRRAEERFSWQAIADRTRQVYARALAR
ncbi:MAG: glycosyl transferase family 1 [Candidatus Lumbricidophila eiseniae]|uniref:D-inositol 3-phosphate glycosyltransferase n=1 Tax=Candidatus Lumbricidiphila eiseniae TaxID=1969409 RepID=A0A2A6FS64_9MICO|nr:MAG: glycosyl transferase family 1 [Candidatus Lumbricidophila eiseniae]